MELWEHESDELTLEEVEGVIIKSKPFRGRGERFCFRVSKLEDRKIQVKADYFIGVDWLVPGRHSLVVVPKINSQKQALHDKAEPDHIEDVEAQVPESVSSETNEETFEVDYFQVLNTCLSSDFLYKEIDELVHIEWEAKEVPINQDQDFLTPLLIVKYLGVLKSIVRKGLKKSYYKVEQNLNSRVRGKILVDQNIRDNLVKNRLTNTWCRFEVFGVDDVENRLLKKALGFCRAYIDNHERAFAGEGNHARKLVNYCQPAFGAVADDVNMTQLRAIKPNPLFREYKEGLELAKLILKRCSYSISNAARELKTTPPYWIDMPKLFELYAYSFLKKLFAGQHEVKYHRRTRGNELDFLVNSGTTQMVVDAKYKAYYTSKVDHQDMRQVSGYARLRKIHKELGREDSNELVDCLIIYPDPKKGLNLDVLKVEDLKKNEILAYKRIYKVGIWLPEKVSK